MSNKQKIVLPGEELTTEEEYASGKNTFSQKGKIKASTMGVVEFDDNNKEVNVKGKTIEEIKQGDIVIGQITLVKESTVVVELLAAEGGKRITGIKTAQLPVRNVSTEYISELKKTMKIGDILRAKVVMSSPLAIDIATNETGLGVTHAFCSNCRKELAYSGGKMMCLACGNVEERKWFEIEQKPREFRPREGNGFGGHREGGFRPRNGGFGGRGHFGGDRGGFNRGPREGGFRPREGNAGGFGERRSFGNRDRNFNSEGGQERSFGHGPSTGGFNRDNRPHYNQNRRF
jgi:exosome complex RNA-binding protein Csl4